MVEPQEMNALMTELRGLLLTPAKRTPAAQHDEVSRRVNLLAVQYGNLTDDQAAFECISLIGLAQIKGNRDAAKKSLKFGRWAEQPPPSLDRLATGQERRGAVKQLSAVRAPWIGVYVATALGAVEQEPELTGYLLAWAYAASESAAGFLECMAAALRNGVGGQSVRLKLLLKLALKNLSSHRHPAGAHCADAFVQLASAAKEAVTKFTIPEKDAAALQEFVIQAVDLITAQEPVLLLNTGAAQAVGIADSILGKWSSGSKKYLESLSGRMLSAGCLIKVGHEDGAAENVGSIFKFAVKVLPLEKTAKRIPERQVLLKELLQGLRTNEEMSGPAGSAQDLQDHVASLLVACDGDQGKFQLGTESSEIDLLIKAVASAASVERFGEKGREVPYRPLEQSLVEQSDSPPVSVRIELPGVRARREDGSHRVLIKAVVSRL